MSPPAPAAVVASLCKTFETVNAVDHVSFAIPRGTTLALLGSNGAGKTTLIAMLLGLVTPTSGSIEILGHDIVTERHRALARMNFESPYVDLPKRLTIAQNLTIFGKLYGVANLRERIMEIARDLDLTELLDRRLSTLSAGQKTRAGLAKALINKPDLLLLDEPTASLDPDTADWVRSHLKHYQEERGASIVLASHYMAEVERLADRVLMMRQGRIEDEGTPRELIKRYGRTNLEEVFLDVSRGTGWDKTKVGSVVPARERDAETDREIAS